MAADELLPLLMAVLVRAPVDNLCAHFSFIQVPDKKSAVCVFVGAPHADSLWAEQFRNDRSAELKYYLTTVRAALEFVRESGGVRPLLVATAEGASGDVGVSAGRGAPAPTVQEMVAALRAGPEGRGGCRRCL